MTKYIHGYTRKEQDRLFRQSFFLEPYIYNKIDFITEVLLSAAPALIALEKITPLLLDAMILELQEIKNNQDSIFVWPLEQLKARV